VRAGATLDLVRREMARTRGALVTAGFGIAAGVAALAFFVALGLGARAVLLGDVFPIDQIELEPPKTSAGLLSLLGGPHEPAGIEPAISQELERVPGVLDVYPKLRFRFPASARGGKELLGREVGTHEMIGDGIDPALVVREHGRFGDPLAAPGRSCRTNDDCAPSDYCEKPSGAAEGRCSAPVPALVSRYLVELFDHAIAPAHGLPPVAESLLARADGVSFELGLGNSLLGVARQGQERRVKVQIVGVSPKAIDLGATLPIEVVRRWNREYAGEAAGARYTSVVVRVDDARAMASVLDLASRRGLVPKDTRARDVSVLISGVMALLVLVAVVILLVAAFNIAHTFRVLVAERAHEIGLYRALGASARDMQSFVLVLALLVGSLAGALGVVAARLGALAADWRAARDLPDFPFKPESFFAFPAWLWLAGIAFAALFALAGAVGPARRAARTDPAAALARS
jgi:putative ABC transport system permease protein